MTKMLIVDDNRQSLYMLQVLLTGSGFEVEMAANGAEALEMARRAPPEMIISDILMPVMDGFALCRAWKADESLKDIPFVFYTATYTDPRDEELAMSLGAARFIVKPLEPDIFLALLREVIETPRAGKLVVRLAPIEDEVVFYKEYNRTLVRKLEDKVLELKQANRQTQISESFLRDILRTTPSAVFTVDPDHNITSWNAMAERITGYRAEEVLGRKCDAIESPNCGQECRLFDDRFQKPGEYRECVIFSKEGKKLTILKNFDLLSSPAGKIRGGVESFIDITERKQAVEALRESEKEYRGIVENAKEGIFRRYKERFLTVNQAFADMLGYESPEEVMETITANLATDTYVRPEDRIRLKEMIAAQGYAKNFEVELYRKDRSRIWISLNVQAVRDDRGKLLYNQGICEEITLKKLADEERQQAIDRLRETLEATVQALAMAVETRDPYTAGHQRRVAHLTSAIASEIGFSAGRIDGLRMASIIHDIGKISIPAEILSMPRRLTDIEFSLIKTHVQNGYEILKDIAFPWPIARMVLEHHERLDGSGYPHALTGDKLLMESCTIAVADVVEAMASHRPYRPGVGIKEALAEISRNKGILYAPEVAAACLKLFHEQGYHLEN